ncbi:hypothetical protein ACWFRK_22780 [Streptomyces sp. NPDC055157]
MQLTAIIASLSRGEESIRVVDVAQAAPRSVKTPVDPSSSEEPADAPEPELVK